MQVSYIVIPYFLMFLFAWLMGLRYWDYIHTLTWGFQRCSFRLVGQCEGLSIVERVTELAPRFVYLCLSIKNDHYILMEPKDMKLFFKNYEKFIVVFYVFLHFNSR